MSWLTSRCIVTCVTVVKVRSRWAAAAVVAEAEALAALDLAVVAAVEVTALVAAVVETTALVAVVVVAAMALVAAAVAMALAAVALAAALAEVETGEGRLEARTIVLTHEEAVAIRRRARMITTTRASTDRAAPTGEARGASERENMWRIEYRRSSIVT